MNYYPHHIGDYAKDTGHLSWDEDMAYTRLLRAYYSREGAIPADQAYRLARASSAAQRKAVDSVLGEFFTKQTDGWHNKRADAELAIAHEKSEKARSSAAKRWQGGSSNANAMRTHTEGIATQHTDGNAPNNQEPITKEKENKEDPPPDGGPVWTECLQILVSQSIAEKQARSFLGLLCREYTEASIVEAVKASIGKANIPAYVRGVLRAGPKKGESKLRLAI